MRWCVDVVGLRRKTSPDDAVEDLKIRFVVGDLLDAASLREAMQGIDWVFHVAAVADYWQVSNEVVYRVNVDGAKNVMQAALDAGVQRLVLTSSSSALGLPKADGVLLTEEDTFSLKPSDFPYGHSKSLAEEAMHEFVEKGLPALSVLPSAVIGPRDLKFNAGELILQALKPTLPVIPIPKGGLNYIDVRDLVDGMIAAAQKGKVGGRYLLAGHNLTHRETIESVDEALGTSQRVLQLPRWLLPPLAEVVAVLKRLGVELPIDRGRVLLSRAYVYYDNSRAVNELGLQTRPFVESVRDAYDWYVENDYFAKRGVEPL